MWIHFRLDSLVCRPGLQVVVPGPDGQVGHHIGLIRGQVSKEHGLGRVSEHYVLVVGQHVAKLDGGQLLQTPRLVQGIGAEDVIEDVFDLRLQRFTIKLILANPLYFAIDMLAVVLNR